MRLSKPDPDVAWEPLEKDPVRGAESDIGDQPTTSAAALTRALLEYEWALRSLLSADAGLPEPFAGDEPRQAASAEYPKPRASEVHHLGTEFRRAG